MQAEFSYEPYEGSNVQAEFSYEPYEGWGEDVQGGLFATYILVPRSRKVLALRLGEQVLTFRMEVTPKTIFMRPIMDNYTPLTISYVPINETDGTLEALGVDSEVFLFSYNDGTLADGEGSDYNPTRFRLTLEDGSVYIFDTHKGLLSMTDPYGHAISYSDSGISHSSGTSLSFERDTSNRIERIVDELGRTIEYRYGEDGMLQQVIQQGGGSYATKVLESYAYNLGINDVPVLKDILAPDGTRLGSFEYDSQGRKTGLIDHEGNRVVFGYDAPAHHYTVTDRRGNPTHYTYDSDGNVTSITDAEGNTESYSYNEKGYVLSKTNKLGYTTAYSYDADGNVLTETDPLGNSISFTYNSDGNKLSATDPLGNTTSFTYDAYGNVLTQTDVFGHVSSLTYDADGNLTSTTDALGHTTSYEYDPQGNMTRKTDPLGNSVELTYDLYGNVIQSRDELGNTTQKQYDGQGNVVEIIDALGHTTTMNYHHSGKVTAYTDAAGNTTRNAFDANGNLVSTTDPTGQSFSFEYDENEQQTVTTSTVTTANGAETVRLEKVYDALNRVTEQIDADGLSTKAEYDALGRQTATIDKLGNRTEYEYDPRNLLIRQKSPSGEEIMNTYDAGERLVTSMNKDGRATHYTYDTLGRVTKTVNHNGIETRNEYDDLGRLIQRVDSDGHSTTYTYDAKGRRTTVTNEFGHTTVYEYYPNGTLKSVTDERGNDIEYEYDANGNLTKVILPDGNDISYTYDESGNKISQTDQNGHTEYFDRDEKGLLVKYTDGSGNSALYAYNEVGNLLSRTDANKHTTYFEYDKFGRIVKKTYPLGMFETIRYDTDGREIITTDFEGNSIVREYDDFGRLVKTTYPDNTSIAYSYTSFGEIAAVTDMRGTTAYEYDDEERLVKKIDPEGNEIGYIYDNFGRRTALIAPSGMTSYTYDSHGRLERIIPSDEGEVRYHYDAFGNTSRIIYPNGAITEYGYDTLGRLISVTNRTVTGDMISSYTYTLDSEGRRLKVEENTGRTVEYHYDGAYRLVEEKISAPNSKTRVIKYSYDAVGNRLTKDDNGIVTTYMYDANDRLLQENTLEYTYDKNGNVIRKAGNGQQIFYTYDHLNQLVHAEIETDQNTSTASYLYDHDGMRIQKTVNGETTRYLIDELQSFPQVIEEHDKHGYLTTSYLYGHDLIAQTRDEEDTSYYHYDAMGSTRALTDRTGDVSATFTYDAYGMSLHRTGTTSNNYLYRGEQFDPDLDSYYLRVRYYHQGVGRFMNPDPFEGNFLDSDSMHRYVYGYNDPINNSDPSGKWTLQETLITTAIINTVTTIGALKSEAVGDVYADFGEYLFPDAYIIGFNLTGSVRGIKGVLDKFKYLPPLTFSGEISGSIGAEAVLNISSAQVGGFLVPGFSPLGGGIRKGVRPFFGSRRLSGSFTLYKGYVWNLWNVQDYSGHFVSASLSWGKSSGGSLFADPIRKIKGPWGISRFLFSKSTKRYADDISAAAGYTHYTRINVSEYNFDSEFKVGGLAVLYSLIGNGIKALHDKSSFSQHYLVFDASLWWQTTLSKYHWNKRNYSIETRQHSDRLRDFPHFQSGPGLFVLYPPL